MGKIVRFEDIEAAEENSRLIAGFMKHLVQSEYRGTKFGQL